ncbi:MAG: hypothetical protein P8Y70_04870 [Candidatus Lokiarchaeota archaeon]
MSTLEKEKIDMQNRLSEFAQSAARPAWGSRACRSSPGRRRTGS